MQEASFQGVLRALLWIFAFYYIFKFLARLFLPVIVRKVAQKTEEQIRQQYQNRQHSNGPQPHAPKDRSSDMPRSTKKVGEYIDYEEIP